MRVPSRGPSALAVCTALLTACSGSSAGASAGPKQPAASTFAAGTCRTAAPDILEIGKDAYRLGKGPEIAKPVVASLTSAQDRLSAISDAAEPAYKPAFTQLVVAVGLIRLQAHVGSYRQQQGDHLVSSYDAVVTACTHPAS